MTKNDIFDNKYKYLGYFIFKTDEIFEKGIPLRSKKINICLYNITNDAEVFKKWLENINHKIYTLKDICILKIPAYYFGIKNKNNEITPCMPFIKTTFDYVNGEKNYIIPELILGIYNTENKEYLPNPNYNPHFDPNGLQFLEEQILNMKEAGISNVENYAKLRSHIPYNILYEQDLLDKTFETACSYYIKKEYKIKKITHKK